MAKMLKRDMKLFKELLIKEREKLLSELRRIAKDSLSKSQRDAAGDLSGYAYHMADVATDTYDREFSMEMITSEQKLLLEIDEALKRIQEGTYGACIDCGTKIKKARLKVVPYAKLCIACQKSQEGK